MDYNNIDLDSVVERDTNMLDSYSFDDLLLEINCNLSVINENTVTEQFNETLKNNVAEARSIFKANLKNIVARAIKERKS